MRIATNFADITVKDLSKRYGGLVVFDRFSLVFPANQTTCVMGQSGCGKTTLFRLMMGLGNPDSGTITGVDRKRMAAVFQENRLCRHLDALCNILLPVKALAENREKARKLLTAVGLDAKAIQGKPTIELSGGMQRRVAILRALMADAEILFMDEPLKELDQQTKELVVACIRQHTAGKTLLIATHDPEDIARFEANQVLLGNKNCPEVIPFPGQQM